MVYMKKLKISIVLNSIIVVLSVLSTIMMITGFRFMHGTETILETTRLGVFKFFTVDSNLFMGLVSLAFLMNEIAILKGKKESITLRNYILKLMGTTAVALTCIVVLTYLGPISKYGLFSLLMNSNLFFHLVIPVLSVVTFIFFEKTDKLKFKHVILGIIPTILYAIFYIVNVLIHVEGGAVSTAYDWYWFVQDGLWTSLIVTPIILLVTYLISFLLWKFNRVKNEI